ncbi:hypothetical protein BD770DRAFT_393080 [Pilaira anomala]|nr:hypothetical protein BD770DRAFT_393080 [Pilaira anomala]
MFKGTKSLWPLVSRSIKHHGALKPFIRPAIIHPVYRSFTTTTENVTESTTTPASPSMTQPADTDDWNTYSEQLKNAHDQPVSAQSYIDMCAHTVADTSLNNSERVQRLQHILRHIHDHMATRPDLSHVFQRACNMLMYTYIREGNVDSARLVFNGLMDASCGVNSISIRTIIHGIQKHGDKAELSNFLHMLDTKKITPKNDANFYIAAIHAFKQFGDIRSCQFYFAEMTKNGLDKDDSSYRAMMELYRKAKRPENVLELYRKMKEKNIEIGIRTYSIIISSLSHEKKLHGEMVQIYEELRATGARLPSSIYLAMKWKPLEALKDMKEKNYSPEIRDYNEFLSSYVRQNKFKEALEVYKLMKEDETIDMDMYSYGIVMSALVKDLEQSPNSVFELYQEMKDRGIKPDPVVYTSLLSACSRAQDLDNALALLEEMQEYDVKPNAYTFNSILSIISTMKGASSTDLGRASSIWDKMTSMGIRPDIRTYNMYLSIISKLIKPVQETEEHTLDSPLWDEDEEQHMPRTVKEMLRMYRNMRRYNNDHNVRPDFATYTIVINSLSAAGQLRSALRVYSDAKMSRVILPVTAYNQIMRALQDGGKVSEAMNVWYDMKLQGVLPNNATYEIVLEACEQLGLTDTLISIRNQRKADFNRLLDLERKKDERLRKNYE